SYEGFALAIFICARSFADEHDVGIHIAHAENQFIAALVKAAAGAIADVGADLVQPGGLIQHRQRLVLRRLMPLPYRFLYWLKSRKIANVGWLAAVEIAQTHLAGVLHARGERYPLFGCERH